MTGAAPGLTPGAAPAPAPDPTPVQWRGGGRALLRLLAVQGAWSYERMQGVGAGWAAAPLLRPLAREDAARYREAVARSAEFFNANPNLAGLAVGAEVRAEYDGLPAEQIRRLRTALCSPLGALGDQVFWAGLVPALVALAIVGVALGGGVWPVGGAVAVYAAVRLWTARWALRTGLASGMSVGRVVSASWLPKAVPRVGPAAAFALGLAVPLAAAWLLRGTPAVRGAGVLVVAAAGVGLARWLGARVTALRFGVLVLGVVLLLRWVTA